MRTLLALDGGETDRDIAAAAAFLLLASRDEVFLLMVVHPDTVRETSTGVGGGKFMPVSTGISTGTLRPVRNPEPPLSETVDQAVARVRADGQAYLNSLGSEYLGEIPFESHVEVAERPADGILHFIEQFEIVSMAMGTRSGRSRLGSALFGSVSEEVLRRASVPVLVVKHGTVAAEGDA